MPRHRFDSLGEQLAVIHLGPTLNEFAEAAADGEIRSLDLLFGQIERLRESVSARRPTLDVLHFGDPAREPDLTSPPSWVDGLLYHGLTVGVGLWKRSSKTRFFLAMSFAIANGLPFLGRRTRQGRVLWLQRDMPVAQFIQFSRKLREGANVPANAIPFVASPLDLLRPDDQARLAALVKDLGAEVVLLDSVRGLSPSLEENASDSVAQLVRGFLIDTLRDRLGCSVVLIAHPGKSSSTIRGSGDFEASADSILKFKPVVRADRAVAVEIFGEGRHAPIELAFTIDDLTTYGGGWLVREVDADELADLKDGGAGEGPEARILAFLEANPGRHSQAKIASGARVRKGDVANALVNLLGRGDADYVDGPRGAKLWGSTGSRSEPVPGTAQRPVPGSLSYRGTGTGQEFGL